LTRCGRLPTVGSAPETARTPHAARIPIAWSIRSDSAGGATLSLEWTARYDEESLEVEGADVVLLLLSAAGFSALSPAGFDSPSLPGDDPLRA